MFTQGILLYDLATQTADFHKPGGYTELLSEPGAKWLYSDGGPKQIGFAFHEGENLGFSPEEPPQTCLRYLKREERAC